MRTMSSKSPKRRSRSVFIERGRYCSRVFTRVLAWKEKKYSIFMPCGAIELLRMYLKEFKSKPRKRATPWRRYSDSLHGAGGAGWRNMRVSGSLAFRHLAPSSSGGILSIETYQGIVQC